MMMALMMCFVFTSCDKGKKFNSKEGKIKLSEYQDSISFTNTSNIETEDSLVNLFRDLVPACKMSCKHPLTFIPRDFMVSNINNSDTTNIFVTFEAKNSFGVPGNLRGHFVYVNGTELEEKRFIY